ncbi:hypothetical protein ACFPN4_00065 [Ureibacillus thermophilus]|nr:hypothetical protein [Ureibacillus thermophilus]
MVFALMVSVSEQISTLSALKKVANALIGVIYAPKEEENELN